MCEIYGMFNGSFTEENIKFALSSAIIDDNDGKIEVDIGEFSQSIIGGWVGELGKGVDTAIIFSISVKAHGCEVPISIC